MKKVAYAAVPFLVLTSLSLQAVTVIEVADPLSPNNTVYRQQNLTLPTVGTTTTEASFGMNLTRRTNAGVVGSRHEYSRFDPYNTSQSMILLNGDGGRSGVYGTQTAGAYNTASNLITTLSITEARWDRNNSNKLWGFSDSSIKTVDFSSGTAVETVVKNFSQDSKLTAALGYSNFRITMNDEGEASYDNKTWAFITKEQDGSGRQHIVTWDNEAGVVLGTYELTGREKDNIDWVGMSAKGNYVLVGGLDYSADAATQNITGLTMANTDFSRFHRLDYTTAHADITLDSNGNEVVVMQNTRTDNIDMIPVDWETKAIIEVPLSEEDAYAGTNRTALVDLNYDDNSEVGFNGGVHISGNFDGYVLISTTIDAGIAEENWLDRSIVLVELNAEDPTTTFLSKIYNTTDAYWQETHGTISNDGTRVLWAANWDNVGDGDDFDNFLLELDISGLDLANVGSVPLPAAAYLMGSALIGLLGFSRKRKKQQIISS